MNLAILKKSRRAPEVGDIFAMHPPDGMFLFGRVISTQANPLGVGGALLIYIYQQRAATKAAPTELLHSQLLVAPIITNKLPWAKGYFEFVESRPLGPSDRLPRHSFRDSRGWYFDEFGNRLQGAIEPVGQWGLHSFRTIDDEISKALGLPLSTE
jgi:hypothetical protein